MKIKWVLDIEKPVEPLVEVGVGGGWRRISLGSLPEGLVVPLEISFVAVRDGRDYNSGVTSVSLVGKDRSSDAILFSSLDFTRSADGWIGELNLHTIEIRNAIGQLDFVNVLVEVRATLPGDRQWVGTMLARIERRVYAGEPPSTSGVPRYYTAEECDELFVTKDEFNRVTTPLRWHGVVEVPDGSDYVDIELPDGARYLITQIVAPYMDSEMIASDVVLNERTRTARVRLSSYVSDGYKIVWRAL